MHEVIYTVRDQATFSSTESKDWKSMEELFISNAEMTKKYEIAQKEHAGKPNDPEFNRFSFSFYK